MHRTLLQRCQILIVAACLFSCALGFARAAGDERLLIAQDGPSRPAKDEVREAKRDLRVLFIGNSYCYVNELPAWVSALAAANPKGPKIAVESVTPGGATLKMQFDSSGALDKIRAGGWTHVVLQGQSLEPIANPDEFQLYARKLAEEIKKAGAKVVFYQTWARRDGAPEYAEKWSGGTPKKMQAALDAAYAKAALDCGGLCVRVGDAWAAALAERDPLDVFDKDGSHPTQSGTFLAACTFYEALSGESCIGVDAKRDGLIAKDAERLAKLAHGLRAK